MRSLEINGKTRHFEFGTYTFKIIRELIGIQHVEEVFEGIRNKKYDRDEEGQLNLNGDGEPIEVAVRSTVEHMEFITMFLYACAQHGAKVMKEKIDFDEVDVSGWLDDVGFEEGKKLLGGLIESYNDKTAVEKKTTAQN